MSGDPFYKSPAWLRLAHNHLKRHPICAVDWCKQPARICDHVANRRIAPHRALDPTNVQGLCWACHNRLTRAYDMGTVKGACDADGNTLDPNHPWAQPDNAAAIDAANVKRTTPAWVATKLKRAAVRGHRRR